MANEKKNLGKYFNSNSSLQREKKNDWFSEVDWNAFDVIKYKDGWPVKLFVRYLFCTKTECVINVKTQCWTGIKTKCPFKHKTRHFFEFTLRYLVTLQPSVSFMSPAHLVYAIIQNWVTLYLLNVKILQHVKERIFVRCQIQRWLCVYIQCLFGWLTSSLSNYPMLGSCQNYLPDFKTQNWEDVNKKPAIWVDISIITKNAFVASKLNVC